MKWTLAVMCTPCKGPGEWCALKGQWTCWRCKTPMSVAEIRHMQSKLPKDDD